MSLPRSVAEVLTQHVTLEVEGIDRMYLNVYQPQPQTRPWRRLLLPLSPRPPFASSALDEPHQQVFHRRRRALRRPATIPLIPFTKGQRKDDVPWNTGRVQRAPRAFFVVGKAQEKTPVFRTEKRRNPQTGQKYPWIVQSTAMVNHFYFYCLDEDFGPFFLKFCTYFPYNAKLCINGHEYAKRQLAKEGIPFEALDNGVLSCAHPTRLQQLCDGLSAPKIDALLRKWLTRFLIPSRPGSSRRLSLRHVHSPG